MKTKLILLSAIVLAVTSVAVISADRTFLRDVAENQPASETMMTITPVQVVNLPTETTGELKVQPTKTVVLDLLDTTVTLAGSGDQWYSEPFQVEKYTRLGARVDVTGLARNWQCDVRWMWFEGDTPWSPGFDHPISDFRFAAFTGIDGTDALITCWTSTTDGTVNLTDVKVLLRRE